MKKVFKYLIGVMALLIVILLIIKKDKQAFIMVNDTNVPVFVKEVVNHLNQRPEFNGKHYKIYTAGFDNAAVLPHLAKKDEQAVLWLGENNRLNFDGIDQFGTILTSHAIVQKTLAKNGKKVFFLPEGYVHSSKIEKGKDFIIIGEMPLIKKILTEKKLPYRQYLWSDIVQHPEVLKGAKAVVAEDPSFKNGLMTFPEVFFDLIYSEIPIMAQYKGREVYSLFYLFNVYINFYLYETDARQMIDDIVDDEQIILERAHRFKVFAERYFSLSSVADNLASILQNGKKKTEEGAKGSLSLHITTMVGEYLAGDYWMAQDIKQYLKPYGYEANMVYKNSEFMEDADVYLRLRGPLLINDDKKFGKANVVYQIYLEWNYPNEEQYLKELVWSMQGNDVFVSASKYIADKMRHNGFESYYLPQFTNTKKFYFEADEKLKSEVLFVGNYHFRREGIIWAVNQGLPLTIYGNFFPKGMVKEKYIDNRILRKYYSSAKIVLNDSMPAMKKYGFISNRIFDVTACGTMVISDYMPEIEEIYGDSVPMYKTKEELVQLVQYYLKHDEEREALAKKAQEITLKNFAADKIIPKLYQIIQNVKDKKGIK